MNVVIPTDRLPARLLRACALLGILATSLCVAAPTLAEAPPAADDAVMQEARQLHGEYMALQGRLSQIQQKTMEAHPELKKQEQEFVDLMMSKMNTSGKDTKAEMASIEALEQKLRNEDTPDSERQALMNEYREKAMALKTAQVEALKDPEVREAQKQLMDDTITAMKEQDPQTEKLMQEMKEKQEQMQKIMQGAAATPPAAE
jgi:multidrug efflux pump subunit AcrB